MENLMDMKYFGYRQMNCYRGIWIWRVYWITLFYQGKRLRNWYVEKLVNQVTGRDSLSYLIMEIMKFFDDISKNSIR